MGENKEYMTHQEDMGTIKISEDVVASVATSAALEVEGVSGLLSANMSDLLGGNKMTAKGVRVEMVEDAIVVYLFLMVKYGCPVSDIAKKVQESVFTALQDMTGFKVSAVNVQIGGISFD